MKKISVIGSGSWGTALAKILAEKGYEVSLWSFFPEESKMLHEKREHLDKLPSVKIPDNIYCTSNIEEALKDTNMVVMVVPSQVIRKTSQNISKFIKEDTIVVCCSKGIEQETDLLLTDVIEEEIPQCKICILSGPTHAEEAAKKIPTAIVAAAPDIEVAKVVQDVFMSEYFRVYTNTDVVGVELGGALKNIIALCAGISDGLGFGDNTKAALMTRGMAEIIRLGLAMGAKRETFSGLTGIGDLIVTCTSMHSRNRRAGILIGQGKTPEQAIDEVKMVVEGITTTRGAYDLSRKLNISMPITEKAYKVLFEGENPKEAVYSLMSRGRKSE